MDGRNMVIDPESDVAYLVGSAQDMGRVVAVDMATMKPVQLIAPGDETSVALHPLDSDLYVLTRNSGDLYVMDTGTGNGDAVEYLGNWAADRMGCMDFHAMGTTLMLYATYKTETDTGIARWNPDTGDVEHWIKGLKNDPLSDIVAVPAKGGARMMVSTPTAVLELSCPMRGVDAPAAVVTQEPGYRTDALAASASLASALAVVPATGEIMVAPAAGEAGAAPIQFIDRTGESALDSAPLSAPTAVAADSSGAVYAAGGSTIWRAGSVTDATAGWTVWRELDAEIAPMVVEPGSDGVLVATGESAVWRMTQSGGSTEIVGPTGSKGLLAVDANGVAWLQRTDSALSLIHITYEGATFHASLKSLDPNVASIHGIAWNPHGQRLYATVTATDGQGWISRMDADAGSLDAGSRLYDPAQVRDASHASEPAGILISRAPPCMFVATPLVLPRL